MRRILPWAQSGARGKRGRTAFTYLWIVVPLLGMYGPAVRAAEPKTYQVEMLIFTNENGSMADGGAPARPLIEARGATELIERSNSTDFQRLPETELYLATAKSILEQSGAYDIIEHVAWRQPGLGENAARPVHVHGGANYQYSPIASPLPSEAYGNANPYVATPEPRTLQQLDGTVTVALNGYLSVRTDLVLRKPAATRTTSFDQHLQDVNGLYQYRMRQLRRMRSGELHYFDHPLLGVLVQITPVERELVDQQLKTEQPEPAPARGQKPDSGGSETRG